MQKADACIKEAVRRRCQVLSNARQDLTTCMPVYPAHCKLAGRAAASNHICIVSAAFSCSVAICNNVGQGFASSPLPNLVGDQLKGWLPPALHSSRNVRCYGQIGCLQTSSCIMIAMGVMHDCLTPCSTTARVWPYVAPCTCWLRQADNRCEPHDKQLVCSVQALFPTAAHGTHCPAETRPAQARTLPMSSK